VGKTTVAGDQKQTIRDKSENRETIAAIGASRHVFNCEYPPMSEVKRNLITMKAALEKGGFKRTKAYKLINDGKIIAYKMGHQTMVDADSIDAYHASLPRIEPGSVTR
jgi:hypothetical protein